MSADHVRIARYIGNGCFIEQTKDHYVDFVKRENRPDFLTEGLLYELVMERVPMGRGVLFKVLCEVPND